MSTKAVAQNPPAAGALAPERLDFVDVHRGLAVGLMIWMHTADGWLRPELKHGPAWEAVRSLGGLAAPAFFFIAGVGLGLEWSKTSERSVDFALQRRRALRRGLQLIVLGYALRLQMWMVDAGGVATLNGWTAAIPLTVGFVCLYRSLEPASRPAAIRLGVLGLTSTILGLCLVKTLVPGRLIPLMRVDVLQGLGASLGIAALFGAAFRRSPLIPVTVALLTCLATPWVRSVVPGALPIPVAGYVALWETAAPAPAPSLFPLFPWFSYVPIGIALGLDLGATQPQARRCRLLRWAVPAAILAFFCCEPLPVARAVLLQETWLTQAFRVGYRLGIVMLLASLALGLTRRRGRATRALITLGRASLFVYWTHLQLAFGAMSRPIAKKLGFGGWFVGFLLLVVAMTALAQMWLEIRRRAPINDGQTTWPVRA